jgi:hypothetical protein
VFIDYITLLLVNMTAGFVLLGLYVLRGLDDPLNRRWVPGFAIVGVIAFLFGSHMTLTWPVIGAYNSAFGEMSVLYGGIFLGAALSIARGWSLVSVAIYASLAGAAAVLLGLRIIDLGMTKEQASPAYSPRRLWYGCAEAAPAARLPRSSCGRPLQYGRSSATGPTGATWRASPAGCLRRARSFVT